MTTLKKLLYSGFLCTLLLSLFFPFTDRCLNLNDSAASIRDPEEFNTNLPDKSIKSSSSEIQQVIDSILNEKLTQFSANQIFSQIYESSLQAIYYALSIIEMLGKLNVINQTTLFHHIMAYYNHTTGLFSDSYSERYFDTNFLFGYYPLTSLLQVNCYAILSLDILGQLNSENVDPSTLVQFIWECYHPDTGGFIGQPYAPSLTDGFKYSTMDNTYYAVLALAALGDNWDSHQTEKENLIQFIQGLQQTNPLKNHYGGFYNSHAYYPTMVPMDPNLWSCYYCVKSLALLNLYNAINMDAFLEFFEGLYDPQIPGFKMDDRVASDYEYNLIAAAFGLQLSDLIAYSSYDRSGVVNFLLDNRNSLGLWNSTTEYNLYELIDTFQVIRALYETGEISQVSSNEKDQIFNAIEQFFRQYRGYSLISKQYYTIDHLHAIIRAFHTYGRIQDLNEFFLQFYERILYLYSYRDYSTFDMYYFTAWINNDYGGSLYPDQREKDKLFRSRPIEFFSDYYHPENNELGLIHSHKTTYQVLDTLKTIYKLNQFHNQYDLNQIIPDIIDSQFLNFSYTNYGGFLPNLYLKSKLPPEVQQDYVYLEYTYYAIRALELIADYLGEDDITDFGLNKDALGSYINRYYLNGHFNPSYPNDIPSILRNTYYLIYIMNLLEPNSLTLQRKTEIQNFVGHNVDYTNIKNLYFCYKIGELLNMTIEFDFDLTHELIKALYSADDKDFFEKISQEGMDHEILFWICDMAKNNEMTMKATYPDNINLGIPFELNVSLQNIVLDYFGNDIELEYISSDSEISGFFTREGINYTTELIIPDKNAYYPLTQGEIFVTKGFTEIARFPITFYTSSDLYDSDDPSESPQESTDSESEDRVLLESSTYMALPIMIALIAVPSFVMIVASKKK